jgi:hypothetical protein
MAKIKITPAVLEQPIHPPVAKPATFLLELSPEELVVIQIIGQLIGGNPDSTLRGYIDSINQAINMAVPEISQHIWSNQRGNYHHGVRRFIQGESSIIFAPGSKSNSSFKELVEITKRKQ